MGKQRPLLALIVILVIAAIAVIVQFPIRLGLDLQESSQLPQVKQTEEKRTIQLEFRRETNKPEVQAQLQVRQAELIQLQQKQSEQEKADNEAALAAISAQIKQKKQEIQALLYQLYESVGLTDKDVKNAFPETDQSNNWSVGIEFDSVGAEKFAELTKSMAGTGRSIGIFLNNELISAPGVDVQYAATGIIGGRAVISGNFTAKEAYKLAVKLRGGTLPSP